MTVALGFSVTEPRPSPPHATVRLASVVLLSLSRLAVALLTVRLTVLVSTDWQLMRTTKRPLRSAERVQQPRRHLLERRERRRGCGVDGAVSARGGVAAPATGVATVSVWDW